MSNPHEVQYAHSLRETRLNMYLKICRGLKNIDLDDAETRKTFFLWQENGEKKAMWKFEVEAFLNKSVQDLKFNNSENYEQDTLEDELNAHVEQLVVPVEEQRIVGPQEDIGPQQMEPMYYNNNNTMTSPPPFHQPDHLGDHPVTYFNPDSLSPMPSGPAAQQQVPWVPDNRAAHVVSASRQGHVPFQPQPNQWNHPNQMQPNPQIQGDYHEETAQWSPRVQMNHHVPSSPHLSMPFTPDQSHWVPRNLPHQQISPNLASQPPFYPEQNHVWNGPQQQPPCAQGGQWHAQNQGRHQQSSPSHHSSQSEHSQRAIQNEPQRHQVQQHHPERYKQNKPQQPEKVQHINKNRVQQAIPESQPQPIYDKRQWNCPNQVNQNIPSHQFSQPQSQLSQGTSSNQQGFYRPPPYNVGGYSPRPLMNHNFAPPTQIGGPTNWSNNSYFPANQFNGHGNQYNVPPPHPPPQLPLPHPHLQPQPHNFGPRHPSWDKASAMNRSASHLGAQPYNGSAPAGPNLQPPNRSHEGSSGSNNSSESAKQKQNCPPQATASTSSSSSKNKNPNQRNTSSKGPSAQNQSTSSQVGKSQPQENQGRQQGTSSQCSQPKPSPSTPSSSSNRANAQNSTKTEPKTTNVATGGAQGTSAPVQPPSKPSNVNEVAQRILTPPESPENQVDESAATAATKSAQAVPVVVPSATSDPSVKDSTVTPSSAEPKVPVLATSSNVSQESSSGSVPSTSALANNEPNSGKPTEASQLTHGTPEAPLQLTNQPSHQNTVPHPISERTALPEAFTVPEPIVVANSNTEEAVSIDVTTAQTLRLVDSTSEIVQAPIATVSLSGTKKKRTNSSKSRETTKQHDGTFKKQESSSLQANNQAAPAYSTSPSSSSSTQHSNDVHSLGSSKKLAQDVLKEIDTAVSENLNIKLHSTVGIRNEPPVTPIITPSLPSADTQPPKKSNAPKPKKAKKKSKKQAPPPSKSAARAKDQADFDFLDMEIERIRQERLRHQQEADEVSLGDADRSDAADTEDEYQEREEVVISPRKLFAFEYCGVPASGHHVAAIFNGLTAYTNFIKKCQTEVLTEAEIIAAPEFHKQILLSGVSLALTTTDKENFGFYEFLVDRINHLKEHSNSAADPTHGNSLRSVIYVSLKQQLNSLLFPAMRYMMTGLRDKNLLFKMESDLARMLLTLAPTLKPIL